MSSLSPHAIKHFRRNFSLGVFNGAVFGFVDAIVSPYLVLPLFVTGLGGSPVLVGLLPAIYTGGWLLPQFLISHRLQRLPRKMAVYTPMAYTRIVCWASFTLAAFLLAKSNPGILLGTFFIFSIVSNLAGGVAGTPFMDVVAKTIPANRRGSFFGKRDLAGAICAIAGGYVINLFLSPEMSAQFPYNFAYIFLIASIGVATGVLAYSFVIEPAEPSETRVVTFSAQIAAAKILLLDNSTYRSYLLTRSLLAVSDIASPFYAIYATAALQIPPETVGVYIAMATISSVISNPIFSRLSDRRGNRVLFIITSVAFLAMPVLALLFGLFAGAPGLAIPFGLVFVLSGIARSAANISAPSYLLEIAPASERPLYVGVTNTLLGIATFIPVVGGIAVNTLGYASVMIIALIFSAVAWHGATRMTEPRL